MIMKQYILLLSVFVFVQCSASSSSKKITDNDCDSIAWKIAYLFNDYQLDDKESKLDTIMAILDLYSGKCPKYNANFSLQRIVVFSFKRDYQQGLKYAELLNDTFIDSTYKFVVVNRFRAMIAQEKGDMSAKNKYINEIVNILKRNVPENEIDSIMKFQNADSIVHYKKYIYLQQYFYYLAQIEGIEKVNKYLDSKYNDIEDKYLWTIRPQNNDDFMKFHGF